MDVDVDVDVLLQGVVIGVTSGVLLAIFQLVTQLLSRKIRAGQQARKVIACYTKFQKQVLNPTDMPRRVINPEEPDIHHVPRMAIYKEFQGEMDRLRVNETDHLSHKQKEELFKRLLLINDLLEGHGKPPGLPPECYALPLFKQVLKNAAESPYIKRHGFRLAKGEGE